jgi:hypothetical protein
MKFRVIFVVLFFFASLCVFASWRLASWREIATFVMRLVHAKTLSRKVPQSHYPAPIAAATR